MGSSTPPSRTGPLAGRRAALRLLLLGAGVACLPAGAAGAAERAASEDAVKAAYLLKLRNYVEWPVAAKAAASHTVIGILGADDIVRHMQELPAARDGGPVTVRRMQLGEALDGVQILFIDDSYWKRAGAMAAQSWAHGILLVTESPNALAGGSIINFRYADERVRFEISLDAAERAGLKLSSQLLALAIAVTGEKRK